MEVKITDEHERLHKLLLTEICDQIDASSAEYSAFKLQITTPLGGPGVLGRCKGLLDIFGQLRKRGKLGVLKYDIIKEAFRDSNNDFIVTLIEEREKEIRALSQHGKGKELGLKRRAEEEVSGNATKSIKLKTGDPDPSDGKYRIIDGLDYYETENKTGFLLILHFYNDREGLEGDIQRLTGLFENSLGFDTLVLPYVHTGDESQQRLPDLTHEQVSAALRIVRTYLEKHAAEYYCLMCIVLAHGNKDTFQTADSEYKVHDIRRMFSNQEFDFGAKPKIFIIQACQGERCMPDVEIDDESDQEERQGKITPTDLSDQLVYLPNDADVLILFATTPDHFVRGNVMDEGTYLIRNVVDVVQNYHRLCHFEDMLITIRGRTSRDQTFDTSMMPYTWSTLTKRLKVDIGVRRLDGDSAHRFLRIDSSDVVHIDALENR